MELEDRVKTLEDELKILKNQIQSTLLDIEEQVLIHYYPTLRAEDTSPAEDVMGSLESILSEDGDEAPEETSTLPRVEEGPLKVRGALKETPTSVGGQPPPRSEEEKESSISRGGQPPVRSEEETNWDTWTELVEWVSHSVEKIGGERTGKLIERYAREGSLPLDVKNILLGLISLSDDGNPPEAVGKAETLGILLALNKALGLSRKSDVAMALSLIEEENLG